MDMVNNKIYVRVLAVFVLSVLLSSASASEKSLSVSVGKYAKSSFAPARNEVFKIPINVANPEQIKEVKIEIRSGDDDLVRTLILADIKPDTKSYEIEWDGKDSSKKVLPNEAWHPVLLVTDKSGATKRVDSRDTSGGEEVYDFEKNIGRGSIEYSLPVASRVLVRAGIKNGPMLRAVVDWEPRTKGFHAERWSGRDSDDLIAVEQTPKVAYLIIGYKLPDNTIITYGNSKETYRAYRESQKLPLREVGRVDRLLDRDGKVIRPEFYSPVLKQKSPRIDVSMLEDGSRKTIASIKGLDELITEVKVHPLDEVYLDQERYEISFFVDNEFIAEEEQGFVPYTWRWSPGRMGIKPGKHVMTVNVSGYNGQVGVRNIAFEIVEQKKQANNHQVVK